MQLEALESVARTLSGAESAGDAVADVVCTDNHEGPVRNSVVDIAGAAICQEDAVGAVFECAIAWEISDFCGLHLRGQFSFVKQEAVASVADIAIGVGHIII